MDPRFTEYGAAVCAFVRHATAKEKAAIRKELADHMEDHAQALIDGGFPEDHAARVALESMGDPETGDRRPGSGQGVSPPLGCAGYRLSNHAAAPWNQPADLQWILSSELSGPYSGGSV